MSTDQTKRIASAELDQTSESAPTQAVATVPPRSGYHLMYDLVRREERKQERKARKQAAKVAARGKRATGTARRCKNCGLWIQKRRIIYTEANGFQRDYGMMYIHVNVRKSQHDIIERCYPEPRPIPTGEAAD
jgi:hypothetical protein